jgi:hypothetical protein
MSDTSRPADKRLVRVKPRTGGAAFPGKANLEDGMTLRDWFAGQALAGLLSISEVYDAQEFEDIAAQAYLQADAMIDAREAVDILEQEIK